MAAAATGSGASMHYRLVLAAIFGVAMATASVPAHAACTPIGTVADFDLIRANLNGSFCLANDIDLAAVRNFQPIGGGAQAFTGTFDGKGHALRSLKITSGLSTVGMFALIDGGSVRDVRLRGVAIRGTGDDGLVGTVAGQIIGDAKISKISVSGRVRCSGNICRVGGIVGELDSGTIGRSSVAALISGGNGGAAGGIAGQSSGQISRSYATGRVSCGTNCAVGGLTGALEPEGQIATSFSSAPVYGDVDGSAGGLVGTGYGRVGHSYSTGSVHTAGNALVASSIGYFAGLLNQDFAVGRVLPGTGSTSGGLVAALAANPARAVNSYWDIDTTHMSASARGNGLTDTQLKAALPTGFVSPWDITKGYSYPFLNLSDLPYVSTLATLVQSGKIFTFLPIEQLEPTEYLNPPNFADGAALAAVYTIIARAVGYADNDAAIKMTKIDEFFWNDTTQTATWSGPVTTHATLSSPLALPAGTQIDDSNIIGPLKTKHVVIVSGAYDLPGGGTASHSMLATLFTADASNVTTNLIANDPWTGTQVWIDPATHQVVRPAGFPLTNFTVDGYQTVTFN
jgi:hypothetical protein